jgi:rubrerythrin
VEGIQFLWLRSPVEIYVDEGGDVRGMRCQVMQLGPPDDSGRRRPVPVEGEFQEIDCDTVIYALGTRANPIIAQSTPEMKTHHGDYIEVEPQSQATSMQGVFAGGDIVTGGATVILAMGAGRRAARGIVAYLEQRQWPPKLARAAAEEEPPAVRVAKKAQAAPDKGAEVVKLCPKCRRPLEDQQEEYICCSDAVLTWNCGDCGKVFEGFAFPYGLCPACGGTLKSERAVDGREAKDAQVQEAIRIAVQIELGGQAFYRKGAQQTDDPALRDLFWKLAAMEEEHMRILERRYHIEAPQAEGEGPSVAQVAVYANVDLPKDDGVALLTLAVKLEKRARDFFNEQLDKFERDSGPWLLYRELAAEEQEHVELLDTELRRYRQGKPGLL